jgi:hypothetical protein
MRQPWLLIVIGFLLSLLGFILPLLMVIHVIQSTFFLNYLAAISMFVGLFLGIIGASYYIRIHRGK